MALILLPGPLAQNGDKQEIPLLQDSATPNRMSYDRGTPPICSEDPNEGGLPPRRADMNQVHYMLSNNFYELQKGRLYTFDPFMTQAPNTGYPNGAILWDYNTKQFLQSNKDNNTDNFITTPSVIGVSWMPLLATSELNGLMSAADKTKLDGIEAGAQVNKVTSVNGAIGDVVLTPGSINAVGFFNTAAVIDIALPYTAPTDGWVSLVSIWTGIGNDSYIPFKISIDGVDVIVNAGAARDGRDGYIQTSGAVPVKKGQVITTGGFALASSKFYPFL